MIKGLATRGQDGHRGHTLNQLMAHTDRQGHGQGQGLEPVNMDTQFGTGHILKPRN